MYGTVLCWPWPNSTYVCIVACVHVCYWCFINVARGLNLTLMRYFVVETHYNNDDDGLALILNECMARCFVGLGQTARTFVSLRAYTGVISVQLM